MNPYKNRDEQSKMYKKFIVTYIDLLSKASDKYVDFFSILGVMTVYMMMKCRTFCRLSVFLV